MRRSLDLGQASRWVGWGVLTWSLMLEPPQAASAKWFYHHDDPHDHHEEAFHHYIPHQHHDPDHHTPYHFGWHHRGTFHAWRRDEIRVFPAHRRYWLYRLAQHNADDYEGSHTHSTVSEGAPTLGDLLTAGDVAFKRSDYAGAAEAFHEAAVHYPEQPIPHFAYGHTLFALGHFSEAAQALREGMAWYPDWGNVRMNRRAFYTDPAAFDRQLHRLEEWVAAHPEDANARFLAGYHYYFTQQPYRARGAFEHAIRLNPGDREARYFLSLLVGAEEI